MVLKKVENPLEYGVVVADAEGKVQRFLEKPGWGEVCSDTVNTGIYIQEPEALKYIPSGKPPTDFGREMFPNLVDKGQKVFGYVMRGYWCDIGDLSAYLKAHTDLMDGRAAVEAPCRPGAVARMPGAQVDRSAVLEGPCFIGEGCKDHGGGAHRRVHRAGRWLRGGEKTPPSNAASSGVARKSAMARRSGARWCRQARAWEERASVFEESALGDHSELGEGCVLMPGVKVWPMKQVACGAKLDQNLVWGAKGRGQSPYRRARPRRSGLRRGSPRR